MKFIFNKILTERPEITSIEKLDNKTLRIRWKVDGDNQHLKRFRLFYYDERVDKFYEWPGKYRLKYTIRKIKFSF